jgi:RNA:NAD 2'-phosphotransferase (TPT1/KptA family)
MPTQPLEIDTNAMANNNGHHFYLTDRVVWLVDRLPPQYLQLLE